MSDVPKFVFNFFYTALPYLEVLGTVGESNQILLRRKTSSGDSVGVNDDGAAENMAACPFYDSENDMCTQYQNRPMSCRAFPLGYDGQRYYVKDKSCPGIGKGMMTAEQLSRIREDASREQIACRETRGTLPPLNTLFTHHLLHDSARYFNALTDEQKQKLLELFGPDKL